MSDYQRLCKPRVMSYYQEMVPSHHWIRSKAIYTFFTFVLVLCIIAFTTSVGTGRPSDYASHSRGFHLSIPNLSSHISPPEAIQHAQAILPPHLQLRPTPEQRQADRPKNARPEPVHLQGVDSRYAFATFLVGTEEDLPYEDDRYFQAVRTLCYQLLHSESTRTKDRNIPFIVAVSNLVGKAQRDRLRADGAFVLELPGLSADWLAPSIASWDHVMTKLRLWELVDFDRVAFLDADTILTGPLDDLFEDAAVQEQRTSDTRIVFNDHKNLTGFAPMPDTYVFAGNAQSEHGHHFPPSQAGRDWPNPAYLNAGFFVIKPDIKMLEHYVSVLNMKDSFESSLPEQNLLNLIHRWDGSMPWKQVDVTYNIQYPVMDDIENGARTLHEKFWAAKGEMRLWMEAWRWEMEGFHQARDQWMTSVSQWQ